MKILVTGATGYVGSAVLRGLVRQGHEVTGIVRRKALAGSVEAEGAKVIIGNLLDSSSWAPELRQNELVISASQPVRFGERLDVPESHRRSYYHGKMVANLFLAAQGSQVKGIAVTYGVLGFGDRGDKWVTDATDLSPVGYERSVSGAFWHIDKTSRKTKVPLVNVFTGWVYGPGGWFGTMARGIKNGTWHVVGDGNNLVSLIHIDDLTEAYCQIAARMAIGKRLCMVDGNPVTQRELADMVASSMGCRTPTRVEADEYALANGELASESMTASVKVSADRLKGTLLPELKYPSIREGVPAALMEMGLLAGMEEVGLRQAAGF